MVLQNHMDIPKGEPGSCDEACVTSSDDGNQVNDIKVEEDGDVKDDNDSEQIKSSITRTKSEVSCMFCVQHYGHATNIMCLPSVSL
jgi:hypothetical protein